MHLHALRNTLRWAIHPSCIARLQRQQVLEKMACIGANVTSLVQHEQQGWRDAIRSAARPSSWDVWLRRYTQFWGHDHRTKGVTHTQPSPYINCGVRGGFSRPSILGLMPRRFTAEQFAASKALGELRTQKSFAGDTEAWRMYQDESYRTLRPGEALPPVKRSSRRRPHLGKAAIRQRKRDGRGAAHEGRSPPTPTPTTS